MSILTPNEQTKLTNQLMESIKDLLNSYFIDMGVSLIPTMEVLNTTNKNVIGLREMVAVINTTVDLEEYPSGLSTKTRKRPLLIKRQIYCHIARHMGYPLKHIGRGVFIDHATVLHAEKLVDSLLETNDPDITDAYEQIWDILSTYYKEKYGKDLSDPRKGRNNS